MFQPLIGIPMESYPVPLIANVFLFYYNDKWVRKTKWKVQTEARKFSNMLRYPPELELKCDSSSDNETSFFDLDTKIVNKLFSLSPYDKRDFHFPLYECHICVVICPHRYFMLHFRLKFLPLPEVLFNVKSLSHHVLR